MDLISFAKSYVRTHPRNIIILQARWDFWDYIISGTHIEQQLWLWLPVDNQYLCPWQTLDDSIISDHLESRFYTIAHIAQTTVSEWGLKKFKYINDEAPNQYDSILYFLSRYHKYINHKKDYLFK